MRKLLLLAWLPLVIFLFPLPPQVANQSLSEVPQVGTTSPGATKSDVSPEQLRAVTSALWIRWMENLGLLALGLAVGLAAWRGYRHWRSLALVMSIFYLALVALSYLSTERPIPDSVLFFDTQNRFINTFQMNLRLVEIGISNGSFRRPACIVYNQIVMPIFQLVVLGWLLWLYYKDKART